MNKKHLKLVTYTGMAIFSMFFGAGNVAFPLVLGQKFSLAVFWPMVGLLVTAVGIPLLGLWSTISFKGDYHRFFGRIGHLPALVAISLVMALIGPFGALPRLITLSYSTIEVYSPDFMPLWSYSLLCAFFLFWSAKKQSRLLAVIGQYLTPFLLLSTFLIIIFGIAGSPSTMVR